VSTPAGQIGAGPTNIVVHSIFVLVSTSSGEGTCI
jgi:hypothetical protein